MIFTLAAISFCLAIVPALLFCANFSLYKTLPPQKQNDCRCSVLIPARDEEANITEALESVLASTGIDFEVIVLDDGSSDNTAQRVREFDDQRVRLVASQSLPTGWRGKNFACHQLARIAQHPILIFMDADVRMSRGDSLARLVQFLGESRSALVSGVPRQVTVGLMEMLIIPLIHFVLLGFLPLRRMRANSDPRFAAACGQILAVRAEDYQRIGGHSSIAGQIHDAVALARHFRTNLLPTDLFDATDTFHCRMYQRATEVWQGFSKNAREGLGSPRLIIPATVLLFGGGVLPFLLLPFSTGLARIFCLTSVAAAFLPRLAAATRFRQSWLGAICHPLGVSLFLAIQWSALFRRRPTTWKGRSCAPAASG